MKKGAVHTWHGEASSLRLLARLTECFEEQNVAERRQIFRAAQFAGVFAEQ